MIAPQFPPATILQLHREIGERDGQVVQAGAGSRRFILVPTCCFLGVGSELYLAWSQLLAQTTSLRISSLIPVMWMPSYESRRFGLRNAKKKTRLSTKKGLSISHTSRCVLLAGAFSVRTYITGLISHHFTRLGSAPFRWLVLLGLSSV
jgi:hypothetical protein